MVKLALISGSVGDAGVKYRTSRTARVLKPLIEGGERELHQQFEPSLDGLFDFYLEV